MYHYNDFEAWRGHRDELLQEAEERRLAWQLRAARTGENAPQIRRSLPRLVADLLPHGRKTAGC
jgi:phosphoserine phosphatase